MKLAVVGSRDFAKTWTETANGKLFLQDPEKVKFIHSVIESIVLAHNVQAGDLVIVSGKAKGPDTIAEEWALTHQVATKIFPANWDEYGKSAGYIRNADIVKECDRLICFWDGKSKGAMHSYNLAKRVGKATTLFLR